MVASEPHFGDVVPALIFGDLARRQVAVVVDDGHLLRMAVIKFTRGIRGEKKIVIDKFLFHVGILPQSARFVNGICPFRKTPSPDHR